MAINWSDNYSVGVTTIDNQHRNLFEQVNLLFQACSRGDGRRALYEIIDFLGNYVEEHFQTEEAYMLEHNYPDYSKHKGEHDSFIGMYSDFRVRLEDKQAGLADVIKMNKMITNWLVNHIMGTDKQLGQFLMEKGI